MTHICFPQQSEKLLKKPYGTGNKSSCKKPRFLKDQENQQSIGLILNEWQKRYEGSLGHNHKKSVWLGRLIASAIASKLLLLLKVGRAWSKEHQNDRSLIVSPEKNDLKIFDLSKEAGE